MKKGIFSGIVLISALLAAASCTNNEVIIAKGATVEKLADGFSFTEGPATDSKGNVFFTDQPNNCIWKWSTEGKLSLFLETSGRSNGMFFDANDRLITCADMENELWSIDANGKHTVLLTAYDGKKLNGPNDLWIHPNGSIYFTDPLYARDYWERSPNMQQEGEYVYLFIPQSGTIKKVVTDLIKPNGIIGSSDGKHLYVADIGGDNTYRYDIQSDGTLVNKFLVAPMGSDGMTLDNLGNIYLTGKGVTVFNPGGAQTAHIPVDASWTSNVTFGGQDNQTLFITASDALYAIRMNVTGQSVSKVSKR